MKKETSIYISARSLTILRCAIGFIYIGFGMPKFFHGYSPAEDLAINTIHKLTAGFLPAYYSIILLAIWETVVGFLLIVGFETRKVLVLLLLHIACTFTPLLFFPEVAFKVVPYGLSMIGQYIMKNIIIIGAAWVLWQPDPENKLQEAICTIE